MGVDETQVTLKAMVAEFKRARAILTSCEDDRKVLFTQQSDIEKLMESQKPLDVRIQIAERMLQETEDKLQRNVEHVRRAQAILLEAAAARDIIAARRTCPPGVAPAQRRHRHATRAMAAQSAGGALHAHMAAWLCSEVAQHVAPRQ